MVNYSEWLKNKQGRFCEIPAKKSNAKKIINIALSQSREHLSDVEAREILDCYDIPFVVSKRCRDLTEILKAAKEMPRRASGLALKVSATEIIHKSESGGVKLNLFTDADLESAYAEIIKMSMTKGINKKSISFTLQEMVEHGREVIFGLNKISQL